MPTSISTIIGANMPPGPQGIQGVQGTQGLQGILGAGAGFNYTFSSTTTAADPGSGFFRFNSGTIGSITEMYISDIDAGGTDRSSALLTFDDTVGASRATIYLPGPGTGFTISITVTGAITNNGTWLTIPVTFDTGALPSNGDTRNLIGIRTGIQGVQGTLGSQGTQGLQGTIGAQGAQGTQGTQGRQGVQGTIGSQGTQGTQGTLGSQGSQGTQGTVGAGTQGTQGTISSQGAQGTFGAQGTVGAGTQGSQGTLGSQGAQGTQGTVGAGTQGSQGTISSQGAQGTFGSQGIQGLLGSGSQGVQGVQGPAGAGGGGGSGNARITVTDTAPTSPTANTDFWWQSNTGSLKIYYSDGTSDQWVDVGGGGTSAGNGTGGSVGGANTHIQFNNNGTFDGDESYVINVASKLVGLDANIRLANASSLFLGGGQANTTANSKFKIAWNVTATSLDFTFVGD